MSRRESSESDEQHAGSVSSKAYTDQAPASASSVAVAAVAVAAAAVACVAFALATFGFDPLGLLSAAALPFEPSCCGLGHWSLRWPLPPQFQQTPMGFCGPQRPFAFGFPDEKTLAATPASFASLPFLLRARMLCRRSHSSSARSMNESASRAGVSSGTAICGGVTAAFWRRRATLAVADMCETKLPSSSGTVAPRSACEDGRVPCGDLHRVCCACSKTAY